eukprot:GHVS01011727.1.p1 GENE.GHVS01011727.1~~GHVS01011727.1.p1  ORF type:complete len:412 (+),score=135.77 GHVS01011727.1:143-1378(+)
MVSVYQMRSLRVEVGVMVTMGLLVLAQATTTRSIEKEAVRKDTTKATLKAEMCLARSTNTNRGGEIITTDTSSSGGSWGGSSGTISGTSSGISGDGSGISSGTSSGISGGGSGISSGTISGISGGGISSGTSSGISGDGSGVSQTGIVILTDQQQQQLKGSANGGLDSEELGNLSAGEQIVLQSYEARETKIRGRILNHGKKGRESRTTGDKIKSLHFRGEKQHEKENQQQQLVNESKGHFHGQDDVREFIRRFYHDFDTGRIVNRVHWYYSKDASIQLVYPHIFVEGDEKIGGGWQDTSRSGGGQDTSRSGGWQDTSRSTGWMSCDIHGVDDITAGLKEAFRHMPNGHKVVYDIVMVEPAVDRAMYVAVQGLLVGGGTAGSRFVETFLVIEDSKKPLGRASKIAIVFLML